MVPHRSPRRHFLTGTASGLFAFSMRHALGNAWAAATSVHAKRCLILWMNGGPSQFETFDPKPGTVTGGDTSSIETSVPGIRIAEHLPELAKRMDRLSVIRNLTSTEGEHQRAQYAMHTGYPLTPAFPRPALGSIVSHELPSEPFPTCVSIGGQGFGPAFLGSDHAPFTIENPAEAMQLLNRLKRRRGELQFLQELGGEFDRRHPATLVDRRHAVVDRIERMVDTPFVTALDVERESTSVRERYGTQPFGNACLVARRLLEAGVRFVEVQLDGWDTHVNNSVATRRLRETMDRPWAAVLDDLTASGLLDETIVLWMGDFGRTPAINGQQGRDHFPTVTPAVIGGGGFPGGLTIGQTDSGGNTIDGPSYKISDLFATLLQRLDIDPAKEFQTSFGSPTSATDKGQVMSELTLG